VAGHSLGEYSALTVAGTLDFAAAIRLVHERGKLMQAAVPEGEGAMAAILADPAVLYAFMGFVTGMMFGTTLAIVMAMYFNNLW